MEDKNAMLEAIKKTTGDDSTQIIDINEYIHSDDKYILDECFDSIKNKQDNFYINKPFNVFYRAVPNLDERAEYKTSKENYRVSIKAKFLLLSKLYFGSGERGDNMGIWTFNCCI